MTKQQALEEARKITVQLVEKYHPDKVILFGSTVVGDSDPNDLDFLIIKDNVPYRGIDRMREVRGLVEKTAAADFLVVKPAEWQGRLSKHDPFIQSIKDQGMVLYG